MTENPLDGNNTYNLLSLTPTYENDLLNYPTGDYVADNGRPVFNVDTLPSIAENVMNAFTKRSQVERNWTSLAQQNSSIGGSDVFKGQFAPLTLTQSEWTQALLTPVAGALLFAGVYSYMFKTDLKFF